MAIITETGRIAIARAIQNEPIYLAWGAGDPAWDQTPVPEDVAAAALHAEIGRRRASVVGYCVPHSEGDILVPGGARFLQSAVPTKHLFFRFAFDSEDGGDAGIRELGVFVGTVPHADCPPGQMYFTPDQVADPGVLLMVERVALVTLSASSRETYETVFEI